MLGNAVIIGAGGQDGSFLLEKILKLGGKVYAITGDSGIINGKGNIDHFLKSKNLVVLKNISKNYNFIEKLIEKKEIDTIFHLASVEKPSGVLNRFENSQIQKHINLEVTQSIIDLLHRHNSRIKFIFASSSKMYEGYQGDVTVDENTELKPKDEYGLAKASTVQYIQETRNRWGLNIQTAILFNHDSIRRKEGYLIWDIVGQVKKVLGNKQNFIELNHPHKSVDLSDARDIVDGLYLMSQSKNEVDYVIGQGNVRKISDICKQVLACIDFNRNVPVIGIERHVKTIIIKSDTTRIKNELHWFPKRDYIKTIVEML